MQEIVRIINMRIEREDKERKIKELQERLREEVCKECEIDLMSPILDPEEPDHYCFDRPYNDIEPYHLTGFLWIPKGLKNIPIELPEKQCIVIGYEEASEISRGVPEYIAEGARLLGISQAEIQSSIEFIENDIQKEIKGTKLGEDIDAPSKIARLIVYIMGKYKELGGKRDGY